MGEGLRQATKLHRTRQSTQSTTSYFKYNMNECQKCKTNWAETKIIDVRLNGLNGSNAC